MYVVVIEIVWIWCRKYKKYFYKRKWLCWNKRYYIKMFKKLIKYIFINFIRYVSGVWISGCRDVIWFLIDEFFVWKDWIIFYNKMIFNFFLISISYLELKWINCLKN